MKKGQEATDTEDNERYEQIIAINLKTCDLEKYIIDPKQKIYMNL